jgi:hypothetical protein
VVLKILMGLHKTSDALKNSFTGFKGMFTNSEKIFMRFKNTHMFDKFPPFMRLYLKINRK